MCVSPALRSRLRWPQTGPLPQLHPARHRYGGLAYRGRDDSSWLRRFRVPKARARCVRHPLKRLQTCTKIEQMSSCTSAEGGCPTQMRRTIRCLCVRPRKYLAARPRLLACCPAGYDSVSRGRAPARFESHLGFERLWPMAQGWSAFDGICAPVGQS